MLIPSGGPPSPGVVVRDTTTGTAPLSGPVVVRSLDDFPLDSAGIDAVADPVSYAALLSVRGQSTAAGPSGPGPVATAGGADSQDRRTAPSESPRPQAAAPPPAETAAEAPGTEQPDTPQLDTEPPGTQQPNTEQPNTEQPDTQQPDTQQEEPEDGEEEADTEEDGEEESPAPPTIPPAVPELDLPTPQHGRPSGSGAPEDLPAVPTDGQASSALSNGG